MKLFIPELGTAITLAKDWTFKVTNESRNASLAALMGKRDQRKKFSFDDKVRGEYYNYRYPFGVKKNPDYTPGDWREPSYKPVNAGSYTFPEGTTLVVDRIYIRAGNKEFSSVTFKTRFNGKLIRFFAKLDDVNEIEF